MVFAEDMFAFTQSSSIQSETETETKRHNVRYRKLTAQLTLSDEIKRTEKVIGQNICLPFCPYTVFRANGKRH